jgi:hypothetical protein
MSHCLGDPILRHPQLYEAHAVSAAFWLYFSRVQRRWVVMTSILRGGSNS